MVSLLLLCLAPTWPEVTWSWFLPDYFLTLLSTGPDCPDWARALVWIDRLDWVWLMPDLGQWSCLALAGNGLSLKLAVAGQFMSV